MGDRARDRSQDAVPLKSSCIRWDHVLLGALLGAATSGVGYWPAMAALRDAFEVPAFPPGGTTYWMCWWLPVVVVVGAVGILLFPRSSRSFAGGFISGLVAVAAVMCAFGYSVDSMPFYM